MIKKGKASFIPVWGKPRYTVTLLIGYYIFLITVEVKIKPDMCKYEPFLNVVGPYVRRVDPSLVDLDITSESMVVLTFLF